MSGGPGSSAQAVPARAVPADVVPAALARSPRRRAWLGFGVVALATLIYLTGWSTWAHVHTAERHVLLPPGAAGSRGGAEFRLLSLVRSTELADSAGGPPQVADAGATFVVAEVEVVRRREDGPFLCAVDLLGTGGRVWSASLLQVQRAVSSCRDDEVATGRPYRFESVFLVPGRDADALVGVALTDHSGGRRSPVLRPPP